MQYLATDLALENKHGNVEPVQAERYLRAKAVLRKAQRHIHALHHRRFGNGKSKDFIKTSS